METIKNATTGYFLLLEVRGGKWDDSWSKELRSLFIEENSDSIEAIKEILKEYNFEDYEFDKLMEYINKDCSISSYDFEHTSDFDSYRPHPDKICLYLYTAVKIDGDVFRKVSILSLGNNELEEPPE